jgi:hypothetical protein
MPPAATTGSATLYDLREQRERSDLRAQVVRQKHAAVPPGLETLRDDRIHAVRFKPPRLVDSGCRGEDLRATGSHARK